MIFERSLLSDGTIQPNGIEASTCILDQKFNFPEKAKSIWNETLPSDFLGVCSM